jgi:GMP synthase-like glutamine amidotransferase
LSVFGKNAVVFQWHSDTFSVLPENALLIASNNACAHHGFIYGNNVYAFQFHLELTCQMSLFQNRARLAHSQLVLEQAQMTYYFSLELEKAKEKGIFVQTGEEIRKQYRNIAVNNTLMFAFLDRIAEKIEAARTGFSSQVSGSFLGGFL